MTTKNSHRAVPSVEAWGKLALPARIDQPAAGEPPWKDNAFLIFWDPVHDVYAAFHVSTSPNANERLSRFSVQAGGITVEVIEEPPPHSFNSASIAFDLAGAITVRHPDLTVDLTFAPRGAVADYNRKNLFPTIENRAPIEHYQQAAIVTGSVILRGKRYEVDAIGMRDRTWGFRDESRMFPEYMGLIVDVEGELLTVMKFMHEDGSCKSDGFLLAAEARPAKTITDIARTAAGLFAGARVEMEGGSSISYRSQGRLAGFWIPMGKERIGPTMSSFDEFIKVTTHDGRTGYGFAEQGIVRRLT